MEQTTRQDEQRDLLRRYDAPKPRYTSYPTAPWFKPDFDRDASMTRLAHLDDEVALYVHVPFCERRCLFCGCNTLIRRDRELGTAYVNRLIDELSLLRDAIGAKRTLKQLALGGGTPTFLLIDDMRRLVTALRDTFVFADDIEMSIEVDPRSVSEEDLRALCKLGFGRFSFGVQDLDPAVMRAVGRPQSLVSVADCFQVVRDCGVSSVNADLMYGLPQQTAESMRHTIEELIALAPDRIALFGYAHVPWLKPHQRGLERRGLPEVGERVELQLLARELLLAAGYVPIGMDHFALPHDTLAIAAQDGSLHRNFMGYTTGAGLDLVSIGVSAISFFQGAFTQNTTDIKQWHQDVASGALPWAKGLMRTADDQLRGGLIEALMCDRPIVISEVQRRLDVPFQSYFEGALQALKPLQDDGLVKVDDDVVEVTEKGRLMMRHAAAAFDAHSLAKARYSRTS